MRIPHPFTQFWMFIINPVHLYSRNIKRTASKGTASLSSLRYLVRYSVAYKVIFKAVDNLKDGFLYE